MRIRLSSHASRQAKRRGIPDEIVLSVASDPQQTLTLGPNREVRQSRIHLPGEPEEQLIRVVIDQIGEEYLIVTTYRTSKIRKYWRQA